MKTTIAAFGLLLVACTAPVTGGSEQQPAENADPNSFLQPGGNSYSAPPDGHVVVLDTLPANYKLHGTPSATGACLVDQSALHGSDGDISFNDDGTVMEPPYSPTPVGTWKQTGTTDEVCLYGSCQTCSVQMGTTTCQVSCPNAVVVAETYEDDDLIPFTFNCVDDACTTLGGATVNADGTVTYGGIVLATWKGTHVEAEICFTYECSLFHPTP